MPTQPLPPLVAVIERIEPPPPIAEVDPTHGALGRLLAWWSARSAGSPPCAAHIPPPPPEVDVDAAILAGIDAVDRAVDAGSTLVVLRGNDAVDSARSGVARGVIGTLTRREASALLPQPAGMTDGAWMRLCRDVRDHTAAAAPYRGEYTALLAAAGATGVAFWTGALLSSAARGTACLVDGIEPLAATVVADRLAYQAHGWWLAASDSCDPGRAAAIERAGLAVGLPLDISDDRGLGTGAVLAVLALLCER